MCQAVPPPGTAPQSKRTDPNQSTPTGSATPGTIDYSQYKPTANGGFDWTPNANGLPPGFDFGQWSQNWNVADPRTVNSAGQALPSDTAALWNVASGAPTTSSPSTTTTAPAAGTNPAARPQSTYPTGGASPTVAANPAGRPTTTYPAPTTGGPDPIPAQTSRPVETTGGASPVQTVPNRPTTSGEPAGAVTAVPAQSTPITPVKSTTEPVIAPVTYSNTATVPAPKVYTASVPRGVAPVPGTAPVNAVTNALMRRYQRLLWE